LHRQDFQHAFFLEMRVVRKRRRFALAEIGEDEPEVLASRVTADANFFGEGFIFGGLLFVTGHGHGAEQRGTDRTRQFVNDARAVANIIPGRGIPPPPPSDKGHFHTESSEFWFILLGQIRYTIEGLPTFIADQGDIVYAPAQTWHRPRHVGTGMATRLAIVGYANSHVYGLTGAAE
jgi:mannose-6-phosphate isomerase-like protein (cupin superfamily)